MLQETKGAGSSENIEKPPAGGVFLDHKPELAVPQGGTSEEHTSAGPEDVSHEFENSATEEAGGQDPAVKNMKQPLDTTNPVNVTDGPEERGPREAAAHANTAESTDASSKEDRSIAPHQR